MHNLGTVIAFEFWRTIKKKSFWLSVLAFPALIGGIVAVSYFSSKAADTANQKQASEKFHFEVIDNSQLVSPTVLYAASAHVISDKQAGINDVKTGKVDAFFFYPKDVSKDPIEVYGKDVGLTKNNKYSAVAEQLLKVSQQAAISPQQRAIAQGLIKTDTVTFQNGQSMPGIERAIAPGAIVVLFYITFVLMAGRMLASTTEEKENRVIEMLLSTINSRTLIIGKILSLLLVGLVQVIAIAIPVSIIGYLARDVIHLPSIDVSKIVIDPATLAVSVVVYIFAYLLFTGILVAIGSAVPTAKEANSFMGVAMVAMFVPLYAVQAIISDPTQLIVKVFTFFPLTAPITLLLRNAVGNLTSVEAAISIAILAVCAVVALVVAGRTFGYGTMEYNRKLGLREVVGLIGRG